MGRRAKRGSLALLALGVLGGAAIHRATHGVWFARPAAPAAWPERATPRAQDGWVSWNPIPIGAPIRGVWGERPDDVWAWSSDAIMRWDGHTWARVPGPPRDAGHIERVVKWSGHLWARAARIHNHRKSGCDSGGYSEEKSEWCRAGDNWELGECGPRTVGSRPPAPPAANFAMSPEIGHDELARLWSAHPHPAWPAPADLERGYRVGGGEVWAVDRTWRGLAHFDGRAWTAAVNPQLGASGRVWIASADDGWAIGAKMIHRWDGRRWTLAAEAPEWLRSIWGAAADDVWAVGDGGLVMHFDGRAWTQERLPGRGWLTAVVGRARDDVWIAACGPRGFTAHWDGARWTPGNIDPSGALPYRGSDDCLLLAPDQRGRAVATYGPETFAFADGGWRGTGGPLADAGGEPIAQGELSALAAGRGSEMWAVGGEFNQGAVPALGPLVLWRRYDVWRKVKLPVARGKARAVWATGAGDVWVVGNGGLILHFDGDVWRREESGTDEDLVAVHGAGDTIWIVGAEGGLLRRRVER